MTCLLDKRSLISEEQREPKICSEKQQGGGDPRKLFWIAHYEKRTSLWPWSCVLMSTGPSCHAPDALLSSLGRRHRLLKLGNCGLNSKKVIFAHSCRVQTKDLLVSRLLKGVKIQSSFIIFFSSVCVLSPELVQFEETEKKHPKIEATELSCVLQTIPEREPSSTSGVHAKWQEQKESNWSFLKNQVAILATWKTCTGHNDLHCTGLSGKTRSEKVVCHPCHSLHHW